MTKSVLDSTPRLTFDTIGFFVLNTVPADVVLDNIQLTVVPEPSSALAMLAGTAFLGCMRKRVTSRLSSPSSPRSGV